MKMSVPPCEAGCMVVAFDLRRTPEMAFDQHRTGVSAERDGGCVEHRTAGDNAFGLANVGNDGLERQTHASGHAGEAERRAHDFQESAARNGVEPFGSAFGKLAVQGVLEILAAGEFFERAPVFRAGLFGGVVGRGLVDLFADGGQVNFLEGQMSSRCAPFCFSLFITCYLILCHPERGFCFAISEAKPQSKDP